MRVAFIDDNRVVLKLIELKIQKEGYILSNDQIYSYLDIKTFMKEHHELSIFDIISVDYDLGKESIDGLSFIKFILDNGFKGECILLTGDDTTELRENLILFPSVHYVIKTATNDKSKSTISQLGTIINKTREFYNVH